MNDQSKARPALTRWIEAQQLSIAAQAFKVTHAGVGKPFRDLLKRTIASELGKDAIPFRSWPQGVVAEVISAATSSGAGRGLRAQGQAIATRRAQESEEDREAERQARKIAYLLLFSRVAGPNLLFGTRRQFGSWWHTLWRRHDKSLLTSLARTLADQHADTTARLDALEQTHEALGEHAQWRCVENYLYSQLFSWPLLTIGSETVVGTSLPIVLDLVRNAQTPVIFAGDDNNRLKHEKWQSIIGDAREYAYRMWYAKHENHGPRYISRIRNAGIHVDLGIASAVLAILDNTALKGLDLAGRSAVPYFSQVILARFLGERIPSATGVSALLGFDNESAKETADPVLTMPKDLAAKLEWASRSGVFTTAVLPGATDQDRLAGKRAVREVDPNLEARIELPTARTLNDLADIVQRRGWRQFRYVRAADIRYAIHSATQGRPGLEDAESCEVEAVLAKLAGCRSTVLQLDASPLTVMSALWHLTAKKRHQAPRADVPAGLSWVVARTQDLIDEDVWALLWEACDGDPRGLHALFAASTRTEAASLVAGMLNRFDPYMDPNWSRAPDILVLVLPSDTATERSMWWAGDRPLSPRPIFQLLADGNALHYARGVRTLFPFVGKTRVILVAEKRSRENATTEVPLEVRGTLRLLSIFEGGFSNSVVQRYLSGIGARFNLRASALEALRRHDPPLLRYGQGEMHIARDWRAETVTSSPIHEARLRIAAAYALVPVLDETDVSTGIDRCLSTERGGEALRHLEKAITLLRSNVELTLPSDERDLFLQARAAVRWLLGCVLPASWATVQRATEFGANDHFASDVAARLLRGKDLAAIPTERLFLAARAAAAHITAAGPKRETSSTRAIEYLYDKTWQASYDDVEGCSESESLRRKQLAVMAGSGYVMYLRAIGRESRRAEVESCLLDLTTEFVANGEPCPAAAKWLDELGDYIEDHRSSLATYEFAADNSPNGVDCRIKAFGARYLCGDPTVDEQLLADIARGPSSLEGSRRRFQMKSVRMTNVGRMRWQYGLSLLFARRRDVMRKDVPSVHWVGRLISAALADDDDMLTVEAEQCYNIEVINGQTHLTN